MPLLRKIQKAGKLIYISCKKEEIEFLLKELSPEGFCWRLIAIVQRKLRSF